MAEADAEIRLGALAHPFGDGALLVHQPRMLVFLPRLHRPAQHQHEVVAVERRDGLAAMQVDEIDAIAGAREQAGEAAGRIALHVPENDDAFRHGSFQRTGGSTSRSARH
jgi:hypothetical protein